jgi:hypothetical protein
MKMMITRLVAGAVDVAKVCMTVQLAANAAELA